MTFTLANSITPVLLQTMALLFVGNAIIGIIEGAVVSRVFRFPLKRTIFAFIVANYASMWLGFILFRPHVYKGAFAQVFFDVPLHHTTLIIWICVLSSFAVSAVVEWPFCWIASRSKKAQIRRSVQAVLLAQCVSYPLMGFWFLGASNTIGDEVAVVPLEEIAPHDLNAVVYFVDHKEEAVYSINLDGTDLTFIEPYSPQGRYADLMWFEPGYLGFNDWILTLKTAGSNDQIVLDKKPEGLVAAYRMGDGDPLYSGGFSLGFNAVADLRSLERRNWQSDVRGISGVRFEHILSGEEVTLEFSTPFGAWEGRCFTAMPGDIFLFELGEQICILSAPKRQIAFLTHGKGPAVLLRNTPPKQER